MKIGIITQPLQSNYGGLLQNYALQQALKRLGHNPITMDQVCTKVPQWKYYASHIKTFLLKLIGKGTNRQYPSLLNEEKKAYTRQHTNHFIKKYINHTDTFSCTEEFRNYTINHKLDALIAGSDQIWRPIYNKNVLCSFFDFAKDLPIKRLAYAASFGVDYWEFTQLLTEQARRLIRDFDAVSVRELSGINLCKEYLHYNAIHVVDPTMLLDKEDYIRLVEEENEPISKGNLFIYILDESEDKQNVIKKIVSDMGLSPFTCMPKQTLDIYPPVTQWIRGFMDAQFVVCDSFHGAVFSIIFNKPFLIIANKGRGMTRFNSLLETFKIDNRIIDNITEIHPIIDTPINWEKVNHILSKFKKDSILFLKSNLE